VLFLNSKVKGNSYENKICKILTSHFNEKFTRVPSSGGIHSLHAKQIAGDIVTPDWFPFVIECKKQQGWTLEQIIEGKGVFYRWWKQVCNDSKKVNKYPLLIFSKNYSQNYCALYEIQLQNKNLCLVINDIVIISLPLFLQSFTKKLLTNMKYYFRMNSKIMKKEGIL
jgi:hypothetical protein